MHPLYKSRIWFPLAMRYNAITKNRIGITNFFYSESVVWLSEK